MLTLRVSLFALVPIACGEAGNPPADSTGTGGIPIAATADSASSARARTGVLFNPTALRVGDRVAGLTVSKVETHSGFDATVLGSAHFAGELRLTGHTFRHPEFPDVRSVCFEADSASATRMPRWSGDGRRAWFCLVNSETAATSLALPGDVRPAEIVITDFVIHRGASDEVNSAKLVRVLSRGELTSSPYTASTTNRVSREDSERAAKAIVSFLRGETGFVAKLFGDTVTLYVSPEGGSGSRRVSREDLRRPANWTVASIRRHSFVPPASMTRMTARHGVHFNCHEYPLATRNPTLARLPHVGVKLEPDKTSSCLQTWNVTMVFSDSTSRPTLVAALYDQWEW